MTNTAPKTTTTEILTSSPLRPQQWGVLATGLAIFAATTLAPWLLNTNSQAEIIPRAGSSATASQQTSAPVPAKRGWSLATINRPTAYVQFCGNTPSLCDPPPPNPATYCSVRTIASVHGSEWH